MPYDIIFSCGVLVIQYIVTPLLELQKPKRFKPEGIYDFSFAT